MLASVICPLSSVPRFRGDKLLPSDSCFLYSVCYAIH